MRVGVHPIFRTRHAVFRQTPLAGGLFIATGTPRHLLFFSGAAWHVQMAWTMRAAPLKNQMGLGGRLEL
jgi:hypothetical protein